MCLHSHEIELLHFFLLSGSTDLQIHIHVWRKTASYCHGSLYNLLIKKKKFINLVIFCSIKVYTMISDSNCNFVQCWCSNQYICTRKIKSYV